MAVLQNEAPQSSIEDVQKCFKKISTGRGLRICLMISMKRQLDASLAQVHTAKLKETGEPVAIKVQHHSIQSYAEVDMFVVSLAVQAVKYFFPEFEFDWFADEMRSNLPKELDFLQEAHNSERVLWNFKQNSRRYSGVLDALKIPKNPLETDNFESFDHGILSRCQNYRFKLHASKWNRSLFSFKRLAQIFSEMIFIHGFVHCDPHPGNVFIRLKRIK